ncbi:MAG: S-layer homology domain-containing protein [Oscillospiraceae bacterium]|nr:S-layer homology domain-containing protein [Oscillospiraceae bacterium]
MKRTLKRIAALFVIVCLTLTMFTGLVSAAGVNAAVQKTLADGARSVGFSRAYIDDYHFVDAGRAGDAVTAKLPHDLSVPGRTVAVAIQAVDANGNALAGHHVHYILGEYSNGAVTVTYQEAGCRYFAMMPIQGVLEQGTIHHLETTGRNNYDGTYQIYIETRLSMSDDLAMYVIANKTDEKLLNMRFTCYLESDVIESEHNVDLQDLVFEDPQGMYDLIEKEAYDEGVMIKYKLNREEWASWRYMAAAELKDVLQTEVTMYCDARVREAELREAANYDDEVWCHGHLELTYEPNGMKTAIPSVNLKTILIPATMDYIVLDYDGRDPVWGEEDDDDIWGDEDDRELAPVPGALNGSDHVAYVIGYEDGSVRPNNNITRAEVATIFFRLLKENVRKANMTQENEFSDVSEGQWFNCAISTMAVMDVLNGYPDGTFRPNAPITRAEFAAIAARFDGREADKLAAFKDIRGHWGAEEISRAYFNCWIEGYPNGTFCPDQDITRAEAMTLVNRVLHRNPEEPEDLLPGMAEWWDNMNEKAWYYLAVQEATNSHDYARKNSDFEYWKELEAIPDWSLLEK